MFDTIETRTHASIEKLWNDWVAMNSPVAEPAPKPATLHPVANPDDINPAIFRTYRGNGTYLDVDVTTHGERYALALSREFATGEKAVEWRTRSEKK